MKEYNIKLTIAIIFAFFLIFVFSLSYKLSKDTTCSEISNDTIFVEVIRVDTIKVIDREGLDSLAICLEKARDSIRLYRDSVSYQDYINARRIEKIKYYISICEKHPNNKKFFYGWIKRTI